MLPNTSSETLNIITYLDDESAHPKNSVAALHSLLKSGAQHILLHIQACRSGELVVYDRLMININDTLQYVQYLTFDELATCDLGGGQRIITLTDALSYLPDDLGVLFRIVGRHSLGPVLNFFTSAIARSAPTHFISGDQLLLHSLSFRLPHIPGIALLGGMSLQEMVLLHEQGVTTIALSPIEICPAITYEAQRLGMVVWAHGVKDDAAYQHCVKNGVRFATSCNLNFINKRKLHHKNVSMVGVN